MPAHIRQWTHGRRTPQKQEQESNMQQQIEFMTNVTPRKALELKNSSIMVLTAILHDADMAMLEQSLSYAAGPDKDFFDHDFTVIDVSALIGDQSKIKWPALIKLFKAYRLNPVAVRNALPEMEKAILATGLGLDVAAPVRSLPEPRTPPVVVVPEPQAVAATSQPSSKQTEKLHTVIIDTPVRSGQRIFSPNADVIITAAVNAGAEIIADGNIHVYAPLRGRALAGANGNVEARIFTLSMEAELVSIAGVYSTFEDAPTAATRGRPTQIRLLGNQLDVRAVGVEF